MQLFSWRTPVIFFIAIIITNCNPQPGQSSDPGRLMVVATTTIVADVVDNIGGDSIELSILLPIGSDPHSFDPTPQDIARIADADVVFANGAGLESFLDNLIESAGAQNRVAYVSDGIAFLESGIDHDAGLGSSEIKDGGGNHSEGVDPHTWTNPMNVVIWVRNIEGQLSQNDPANAAVYKANASSYTEKLEALDAWIREQVAKIPESDRKIVTDHAIFGYFASAYGFQQVGALFPGFSTLAQPSAQDLAQIEDAIRQYQVNAIFVGKSVNPSLTDRVAGDTGTRLFSTYTGSLSDPGGEAGTYLDYMRYNTLAFVEGLK